MKQEQASRGDESLAFIHIRILLQSHSSVHLSLAFDSNTKGTRTRVQTTSPRSSCVPNAAEETVQFPDIREAKLAIKKKKKRR